MLGWDLRASVEVWCRLVGDGWSRCAPFEQPGNRIGALVLCANHMARLVVPLDPQSICDILLWPKLLRDSSIIRPTA
jgi:hypothetical protein